jgi:hypothetical protein
MKQKMPERVPHALPTTAMEKRIAELVEYLRDGEGTQASFFAAIERAMAHAYSLEAALNNSRQTVADLDRRIAITMPPLAITSTMEDMAEGAGRFDSISDVMHRFDWKMEPIRYSVMLREWQAKGDEELKARVKRTTYRGMLKHFRDQFEKCFDLNPDFYRHQKRERRILAAQINVGGK